MTRYGAEKEALESRDKEPDKRAPETAKVLTRYREKREDLRSRERELNKREPESKKPKSNVYRKKGGDSKTGS